MCSKALGNFSIFHFYSILCGHLFLYLFTVTCCSLWSVFYLYYCRVVVIFYYSYYAICVVRVSINQTSYKFFETWFSKQLLAYFSKRKKNLIDKTKKFCIKVKNIVSLNGIISKWATETAHHMKNAFYANRNRVSNVSRFQTRYSADKQTTIFHFLNFIPFILYDTE